jgi:hypothetical protein
MLEVPCAQQRYDNNVTPIEIPKPSKGTYYRRTALWRQAQIRTTTLRSNLQNSLPRIDRCDRLRYMHML